MRILFFGSGAFGLPTLQRLASQHTLLAVVSQPDRSAGRGGKLTPTPIAAWSAEHLPATPLLKPPKVNAPEVLAQLRGFGAEAWVVIAFGQKLSRALLDGVFAINLHASLLPRWRGAAPINAAILGGDTMTGNSVITLADRMDAGLILGTSQRAIDPVITAGELHDLLSADGPDLVERVLAGHFAGTLDPHPQDESQVTIATKLSREDDAIDFHQPADFLRRQIHALTPWPGISADLDTKPPQPLKLLRARSLPNSHTGAAPGTILDPRVGTIACGHGTILQILDVQPPGKKTMNWSAYANGRTIPPETRMISARELA
jgi:methionyl-tRNA formyltransferase